MNSEPKLYSKQEIIDFIENFNNKYSHIFNLYGQINLDTSKEDLLFLKQDLKIFDSFPLLEGDQLDSFASALIAYIAISKKYQTEANKIKKGFPHILSQVYIKRFGTNRLKLQEANPDKNTRGRNPLTFKFLYYKKGLPYNGSCLPGTFQEGFVKESDIFVSTQDAYGEHLEDILGMYETEYGNFVNDVERNFKKNTSMGLKNRRKMLVSLFLASTLIRTGHLQHPDFANAGTENTIHMKLPRNAAILYRKRWVIVHQPSSSLLPLDEKISFPFLFSPLALMPDKTNTNAAIPLNRNTLLLILDTDYPMQLNSSLQNSFGTVNFTYSFLDVYQYDKYVELCKHNICEKPFEDSLEECLATYLARTYNETVLNSIINPRIDTNKARYIFFHEQDTPWMGYHILDNTKYVGIISPFNSKDISVKDKRGQYMSNLFFEDYLNVPTNENEKKELIQKMVDATIIPLLTEADFHIETYMAGPYYISIRLNNELPRNIYITFITIKGNVTVSRSPELAIPIRDSFLITDMIKNLFLNIQNNSENFIHEATQLFIANEKYAQISLQIVDFYNKKYIPKEPIFVKKTSFFKKLFKHKK
jgi:hypothetical protein